jgi:LCP family protein required for cell wall assembly
MAQTRPQPVRRANHHRSKFSISRLTVLLIVALLAVGSATAVMAFQLVRNYVSSWSITGDVPGSAPPDSSGSPSVSTTVNPNTPLQSPEGPPAKPWDGTSRVTILVMGLDYRDWEANNGPSRTDTMILLTLDPLSKTAGMLSIPRDMWVNIPGYGYYKINMAYFFGDGDKLPGGGPGLAMKTVEEFLGVPIDYYAQIDFTSFVDFINNIGGITINVPEEIVVDPLGPYNTTTLEPGVQHLDGAVALGYARNRETAGGDFDRAKRQQQVIMAIRDQVLNVKGLTNLVKKAPKIYKNVSAGIRTNLTLDQVVQLALLAQQIKPENIHQGVIGTDAVTMAKSPDGLDILVPIPDKIRLVRDEIFATGGPLAPSTVSGDPSTLMKDEKARVSVQNGSSASGIAGKTGDYLKGLGLDVTDVSNANELYANTTIIDYSGKPYTVAYLVNLMNVQPSRIFNRYDPNAQYDVQVIIGQDWAAKNPMP